MSKDIHLDPEVRRYLVAEHLESIIPDGLAKVEFGFVDPKGFNEALQIKDRDTRDTFIKNRIASLEAEGRISPLSQRQALATQWKHLDPDQMRKKVYEYEINLRKKIDSQAC